MKDEVYKYTADYIFDHENICIMLEVLATDLRVACRVYELEGDAKIRVDSSPEDEEEDKGFQVCRWIFHPDFELVPFDPDTCPRMPELMSIKTVKYGTGKELAEEQRRKETI